MTKEKWIYILTPALVLLFAGLWLLIAGARDASAVEQSVVRFHVVANSDSQEDQQIKLKVRDGLFAVIQQLFADCKDREEALAVARQNRAMLQQEAERLLRENGSEEAALVEIGEQFFPTKQYGALSFPAGTYQAVRIQIGAAKGKNFWCVLYPALCIAPAVEADAAADEMAAVLGKDRVQVLKKAGGIFQIRFALAEWWGSLMQKFRQFQK